MLESLLLLYYSFHNKLKTNPRYLAHKVNRRCDDLIHTLNVEDDIFHDMKRKEYLRSAKDASYKCEGNERHALGEKISCESVMVGML